MAKRYFIMLLFILSFSFSYAQLKSPDAFLGYTTGSRFTPHFKIVDYFHHVAANSNIKLEKYGETNEGRPLLLAFISSPENMKNLDAIRINNLRLANLGDNKAAATGENAPAIVWLSYNVHGNETSSSEAAMMTLWALVGSEEHTFELQSHHDLVCRLLLEKKNKQNKNINNKR